MQAKIAEVWVYLSYFVRETDHHMDNYCIDVS